MTKYYLEYPQDTSNFSPGDLEVVDILKSVGKLIGEIFSKQVGEFPSPGAGFYPADATKEEIEIAASKNPKILDPYTVVKRDAYGNLIAVPYTEEYGKELKEISELFKRASKNVKNTSFKEYLTTASKSFLNGDYQELEKKYIAIDDESFLHLLTGPLGSYADRLFSLKKSYTFNLTYASNDDSFNPSNYIEVTRNMLAPFGKHARLDVPPNKIKIRVDNVLAIGGRNAVLPDRSVNYPSAYPNGIKMIKEHGVKILVYTDNIRLRDGKSLLPLFRDLINKEVQKSFSDEFIMENCLRLVLAHEITEAVFQYKNSWQRLKGMFNYVYELHSSIVGIKACGFQVIKGVLSQKDLSAILYIMLMRTFSDYFVRKKTAQIENYLSGYRLFYNYCMENGAIVLEKNTILPNPSKMFACADQLATVVMHLFTEGNEKDAKKFFGKYESSYMYEYFADKLREYDF